MKTAIATAAIAAAATAAHAEFVTNGSMTGNPSIGTPPPGWGSASIDGDTIPPGGLNGWATGIAPSSDGGTFLAVLNNGPGSGFDDVQQIITGFTPGQTYTLSFEWANVGLDASASSNYANPGFVRASIAGNEFETDEIPHEGFGSQTWRTFSTTFVANGETQVLSFRGVSTIAGGYAAGIDGVSIVPAPAAVSLLGVAGLLGARRRR